MQLNPARGRKLDVGLPGPLKLLPGFMQLNPARGRKQYPQALHNRNLWRTVYAAQPREGTETVTLKDRHKSLHQSRVYAAQPREGTETADMRSGGAANMRRVYAAQPREGTETFGQISQTPIGLPGFMQLNPARGRKLGIDQVLIIRIIFLVYAAQPREGTET